MKKKIEVIVAIIATLAVVFVGCSDSGGDPVVVWQPTITIQTEIRTEIDGNSQYLGQTGIQNTAKNDITFVAVNDGFNITGANNNYKQINIQVGTAAGGTNYYCSNGFTAETGKAYTLTFIAAVATGTGQLRFGANQPSTFTPSQNFPLTTTPTSFSFSWTQNSGNLKFDTGSSAATITIKSIKITTP